MNVFLMGNNEVVIGGVCRVGVAGTARTLRRTSAACGHGVAEKDCRRAGAFSLGGEKRRYLSR